MKPVTFIPKLTRADSVSKYDVLLDGQIWAVEEGDFDVDLSAVRSALSSLAKRRDIRIKTQKRGDVLYIQKLSKPGRPKSTS